MSDQTSESSANYILLTRLADEFAARYRAGERPSLQEYIDRYPELADDIRELFPAMVEIEQVREDHQEAAAHAAAPPLPALQQLGDFRILREVGKGGMGIVYEAEQVSLGRHVALKVLPKSMLLDAQAKRRFEREARAAARLHHTNIVPVFGVGEQDGLPYYVMQFIQGLGLDEVLEELKNLQSGSARAGSTLTMGQPRRSRPEISAAQVARSLLTGEFHRTNDNDDLDATAVPEDTVRPHDPAADAPRSAGGVGFASRCHPPRSCCRDGAGTVASRRAGSRRTGRAWRASASRWRTPWNTPTSKGCSTGTSSPRTCSWTRRGRSGWRTSGWPRRRTSPT